MFICFQPHEINPHISKGDTAKEAFSNYKELYDEYVSLDYLIFMEIPENTPELRYRTELVLVGT